MGIYSIMSNGKVGTLKTPHGKKSKTFLVPRKQLANFTNATLINRHQARRSSPLEGGDSVRIRPRQPRLGLSPLACGSHINTANPLGQNVVSSASLAAALTPTGDPTLLVDSP